MLHKCVNTIGLDSRFKEAGPTNSFIVDIICNIYYWVTEFIYEYQIQHLLMPSLYSRLDACNPISQWLVAVASRTNFHFFDLANKFASITQSGFT